MSMNPHQEVNDFFESYVKAMENFDTKAMTQHYQIPCSFLSDDTVNVFTESSKLEGLFNQGFSIYKQLGIARPDIDVRIKHFWTPKIVQVRAHWQYFDARRNPLYDCDYQYILRADKKDAWKIEVSVAINEKERMEAWQKKKNNPGTGQ